MTVVTSPFPPYSNPPINPQFFKPSRFTISDITLGQTTIITTVEDMNYVIGQLIRLLIPPSYGCCQLNETQGFVIAIPADNEVEVTIDSAQNVDPYISSPAPTPAQILAIGDVNTGIISSTGNLNFSTTIPGSFHNISPL